MKVFNADYWVSIMVLVLITSSCGHVDREKKGALGSNERSDHSLGDLPPSTPPTAPAVPDSTSVYLDISREEVKIIVVYSVPPSVMNWNTGATVTQNTMNTYISYINAIGTIAKMYGFPNCINQWDNFYNVDTTGFSPTPVTFVKRVHTWSWCN